MIRLIEFYVPDGVKTSTKWVPSEQRGKLIPFPRVQKQGSEPPLAESAFTSDVSGCGL
jgi:hypothetical protein